MTGGLDELKMLLGLISVVVTAAMLALAGWRWSDERFVASNWRVLRKRQAADPEVFDPATIASLPEPARRFFRFAIRPGTRLHTVAEVSMSGALSLGTRDRPNTLPMRAEQILAVPYGFIWKVRAGRLPSLAGSDGQREGDSWSGFWMLGIVPVARAGHNVDHARSAFGRCVAEAVFWTPAALLPGPHVRWEHIDDATARVVVSYRELDQAVDVSVDHEGRLTRVLLQRWSDANPEKRFQHQPFGGMASEYREFSGFRLPTRVDGGHFFGTDEYFPFFRANVTSVRFPSPREGG